jgi:hypothetical protein
MAEILVMEIRARRPLGGGRLFVWGVDMTRRRVGTHPDVPLFPLFFALFF